MTARTNDTFFDFAALAARASMALLFVPSGWGKLANFAGTAAYISAKGVPLAESAAAIAVLVELGFGMLLLAGVRTRWVALALAVFVAAITPLFHNYWSVPDAQVMVQRLMFWKNVGLFGGLLLLAGAGGGRFSVDARLDGPLAPRLATAVR